MVETAEVIVIGGGIMGTATTYELARRGVEVILFEKSYLAAGSTGLTGGIIRQHYSIETAARMARRSLVVWENFPEIIGGDAGFTKTGVVFLSDENGADDMAESVKMQQSIGISTQYLDREALQDIVPYLQTDDIVAAAYEPDGGFADGAMACTAYANRARELGAEVKLGMRVTGIRVVGGRVAGVETADGVVDAPIVVNTAGPWGPKLAQEVGVYIPAEPSRHQIATFLQPADFEQPLHVVVGDFVNAHYMRADRGGLTLSGSLENDLSDHVSDPDTFNPGADRRFIESMVTRCALRMPALEHGRVQGGWAGLYTVTPDWSPIIDRVEQLPGLILGLGFSGSGFKMGPAVGEMLADLALGENQSPIDPSIYRLNRFKEGEVVSSHYSYGIVG